MSFQPGSEPSEAPFELLLPAYLKLDPEARRHLVIEAQRGLIQQHVECRLDKLMVRADRSALVVRQRIDVEMFRPIEYSLVGNPPKYTARL